MYAPRAPAVCSGAWVAALLLDRRHGDERHRCQVLDRDVQPVVIGLGDAKRAERKIAPLSEEMRDCRLEMRGADAPLLEFLAATRDLVRTLPEKKVTLIGELRREGGERGNGRGAEQDLVQLPQHARHWHKDQA